MGALSQPLDRQPLGGAQLWGNNPLTRGLVAAFVPGASNLVPGDPTKAAFARTSVGAKGQSSTFAGVASTHPNLASSAFSFYALFRTPSTFGTQEAVFGRGPNNLATNSTGFGFHAKHNSASYSGAFYVGTSYSVIGKPTGGQLATDTEYSIGGSYDGTNGRAYNNGILTVGPTAGSTIDTTARFVLNGETSLSDPTEGANLFQFYFVGLWNRALSNAEFAALHANPWQIFVPQPRRFFLQAQAATGAYTLTAAAGSFTETGQDAGLIAARTIAGAAGSFTETGQDAGLLAARTIAGAAGSFTETGQDANLVYTPAGAYTLSANVGTFALTGQDAGLLATRTLALDAGSFTLTGQDATLSRGVAMAADAGSFAVTGQDAALLYARLMAAEPGSFAFTGNDASLVYTPLAAYSLTAAAGSFTLSGKAAALLYSGDAPVTDPRFIIRRSAGRDWTIRGRANNWTVREPT